MALHTFECLADSNSALKPKHVFYKGDAVSSILIRIDYKLACVMSNKDEVGRKWKRAFSSNDRTNSVCAKFTVKYVLSTRW